MKQRNEKKATQKRMLFKLSRKFDWHDGVNYWWVILPFPRNVRYCISKSGYRELYTLNLERIRDTSNKKQGNDLLIGQFPSLEMAKTRAELREARYEVKKSTMERKNESMEA